ncbi:MAG TPA: class I SAM-dependent methyltransferase [Terriglobales bacterium]|nr:class I SAM-dependent methyltransferase [Terriglobales bacterium]
MRRGLKVLVVAAALAAPPLAFAQELHLDVPYVPTRPEVVAKMLQMAHVGKDDVLYDLGCGDGRIVVTAAKLYGTHGTGIDINPERIKESRENAEREGVTPLVRFLQQDLFQTDFRDATVVTLYLLSSVNLRLRPILFEQLRPGTRVVSHDFSMDTWKPDDSTVVDTGNMSHDVYFWVIPANISGSWGWTWPEGGRLDPCRFDFDQHFQRATGRLDVAGTDLALLDLTVSGGQVSFSIDRAENGKKSHVIFRARAVRDTMVGTMVVQGAGKSAEKPWKAVRNPATRKAIDSDGPMLY